MIRTPFPGDFVFRAAVPGDVPAIHDLLAVYAKDRILLPRTPEDILSRIANFHVAESSGKFAGCVALRNYGNGLFEVRSLAVRKEFIRAGLGSSMVSALLELKKAEGVPVRLFALTYRDSFFQRLGFRIVDKNLFPEKIWSDCSICPKKDCCDEIAVLIDVP